jgi:hypothetical protein
VRGEVENGAWIACCLRIAVRNVRARRAVEPIGARFAEQELTRRRLVSSSV